MNYAKLVLPGILMLFISSEAFAQQPAGSIAKSSRYRKMFTIAGGGGGFAAGMFAGLAHFDDAVNSTDKVTTTAVVGAAGGAIGGYFLGRILDKRRDRENLAAHRPIVASYI